MDYIGQIIGVAILIAYYLFKALTGRRGEGEEHHEPHYEVEPEPAYQHELEPIELGPPRRQPVPGDDADGGRILGDYDPDQAAPVPRYAEEREEIARGFDSLASAAAELRESIRHDRASEKFIPTLDEWVIAQAREAALSARRESGPPDPYLYHLGADLRMVLQAISAMVAQRRDPRLRHRLGDADALAMAVYKPLLDFARANRLPLTSATPAALLTRFDMAIWTGFRPTGIAPMFLPPDFFEHLTWWPAIAHEIAHDFLAATGDLEAGLRDQLGLPSEEIGSMPLRVQMDGIQIYELYRIYGGWFEEMFCDVFGTLMLGPAYGYTMVDLFAQPRDPSRVIRVGTDGHGRYDVHPPRHLRVLLCCDVLRLAGEREAADEIEASWNEVHGGNLDYFAVPTPVGMVPIEVEPMRAIAQDLASRLYSEQFAALDGRSLSTIPGVDWGPRAASEARRARDELLASRKPAGMRPRAVIAGAILARRQAPPREREFLAQAKAAIVGVAEWADGRAGREQRRRAARKAHRPEESASPREAFILHTLLSPAPAVARMRGMAPGGLLSPRSPFLSRRRSAAAPRR